MLIAESTVDASDFDFDLKLSVFWPLLIYYVQHFCHSRSAGSIVVSTALCSIFKINLEPNNVVEIVHGNVSKRFKAVNFILLRYAPDYGLWVSGQHYNSTGCNLAIEALEIFDVYPLTFESLDGAQILIKEMYPDRFIRHEATESLSELAGGYQNPNRPLSEVFQANYTAPPPKVEKDRTSSYLVLLFPFFVGLLIGFIAIFIFVRCCWWSSDDINKPEAIKRNQKGKKAGKGNAKSKKEKSSKSKMSKAGKGSKESKSKAGKGSKESKSKASKATKSNKEKSSKAPAPSTDNKESNNKESKEFVKSFSLAPGESAPAYENL
uniref:Uncharacterized protein n=1 Tax=Bursaphelenchus xylophilus TaxID=6326 RepID=A0A1I7S678_BURXY